MKALFFNPEKPKNCFWQLLDAVFFLSEGISHHFLQYDFFHFPFPVKFSHFLICKSDPVDVRSQFLSTREPLHVQMGNI